jgi:DNA-directed RNA polymerase specialized sigma24 family protein
MPFYWGCIRVSTMADKSLEEKFTISPMDSRGRTIAPEVLSVATEIRKNALRYGEKALGDPAVAASLFEESAAAVSRLFARQTTGKPEIRNLSGYLFRAFVRRVNRVRQRETLLIARLSQQFAGKREFNSNQAPELEILIDEILARGDAVMRDMFRRRTQGFSWKEIGRAYGISAHAAESRFSQSLQRLRKRLQPNRHQRGGR